MRAAELARERDSLSGQTASLRNELEEAKRRLPSSDDSWWGRKSLENQLDEERRVKERVCAQLDSRMDELQKWKSKFVCP
jgi:chromosome segregation ATPase